MKKFATLLLAAALIGNSMDLSVLTVNAAEKEKTLICEKEEHTHDEKCYAEAAQKKSITAWTWNDEEEMLDLEENVLALPGASKEQVVFYDDIVAFLPASITATITTSASATETEDTEEAEETVTLEGWVCENYPEEGAYSGNYTFTANLPEGYALAEGVAALTLPVELGGGQTFAEHNYDDNGFCTEESCDAPYEEPEEKDGYREIENAGQLYWFAQQVNDYGETKMKVKLTANITVNPGTFNSDGTYSGGSSQPRAWSPIGVFGGEFDGNGKTIFGLYYKEQRGLLFDTVNETGSVHNLTLANSWTGSEGGTNEWCAGIAVNNSGTIDSCTVESSVTVKSGGSAAGICYQNNGMIQNCINKAKVDGSSVGGICLDNSGTIQNCANEGYVSAQSSAGKAGGICSDNSGTIQNCTNEGYIYSVNNAGGICGENRKDIRNCYHYGSINNSGANLGGVCGRNSGTIQNCYFYIDTDSRTAVGETEDGGTAENTEGKSNSDFSSGAVAYFLQERLVYEGETKPQVWGQKIDNGGANMGYPLLGDPTVYYGYASCLDSAPGYSNSQRAATKEELHSYEEGICSICNTPCPHSAGYEDGLCKVCRMPHEHLVSDWTYAEGTQENTITATCGSTATITLTAPTENLTYDGKAKEVIVKQSPEGVFTDLPAVQYTGGNTNAGTHTASLTVGGVTATLKFTIEKASQTLSFADSDLTRNYGDNAFTPKLNHVGDGKVTYASSNSEVASVDTDGKVTIWKAGTTTITASAAKSNNFNAGGSASYTLTVNRKPVTVFLADRNVTVGSTVPAVALTYQSLANGDTVDFTPVFTLTDKDGKPLKGENDTELTFAEALTKAVGTVGSYTIKWINAEELKALSDSEGNYTFTVVEGGDTATLTVNSQPSSGGGGYSGGGGGTALPDTKPETNPETKPDTKPDETKEETITRTETGTNSKGKEVVTTTTTKTDADGNVISVTEKTVIPESSASTSTTVTVRKDGKGEVTSAKAVVTKTVTTGNKATIQSFILAQIIEAAGTSDVTVSMTVKDADGKTTYSVKADAKDFESGNKLYIYKYDTKTKAYTMVDGKTYTVSKAGNVSVSQKVKATYYLLDAEEAAEINEKILSTIKPKKASVTLKVGESVTFTLSSKANPDNIRSITYTTSKKSVATVNKKGKVYAKKKGTATVKAKVTLKNGMTKTIKMKVKVK